MLPGSVAEAYHQATKYTRDNVQQTGGLDWASEPVKRRVLDGAPRVELTAASTGKERGHAELGRIGRCLYFTNGVTRVLKSPGGRIAMRAAPSAGALYPTELYVVARGVPGLADGVWNYQVEEHALALVREDGAGRIARACADHPAAAAAQVSFVLTAELFRSAWRYKERGYRRVLLDTGHVLGNLVFYAPVEGFAAVPIAGFCDREVAAALRLEPGAEVPLVVCPALPLERAFELADAGRRTLRSGPPVHPGERSEQLMSEVFFAEGEGTATLHAQGDLAVADLGGAAPFAGEVPLDTHLDEKHGLMGGIELLAEDLDIAGRERKTIARRRSCRSLDGARAMELSQLETLLRFAYAVDGRETAEGPRFLEPGLLETYVCVAAVEGLQSGIYYYAPRSGELRRIAHAQAGTADEPPTEPGGPETSGGLRAKLFYAALFQELARDAAVTLVHAADLDRVVRRFGERGYRYAGLDAGHIGQRLNLAAGRLGLGASGIGGFFDGSIASLLLLEPEHAIAYVTTVGAPA